MKHARPTHDSQKYTLLSIQGDHGSLPSSFVDFDLLSSSVYPILVKIGQIWHGKRANSQIDVGEI